ncbi:MAG: MBL fold metallo-hydrolase [Bacteroidales bacterium]|nr:MBL fold metallo-hydrolase [Bacteroidales bacterium]
MDIFRFVVNMLEENTYAVAGEGGRCVLVDPGCNGSAETSQLLSSLQSKGLTPAAILLTHGHPDHTYGVAEIQKRFGIPVYMAPQDRQIIDFFQRISKYGLPAADPSFTTTDVKDGDSVKAAGLEFRVISTPGHTPGGVCYLCEDALFTGDTLFAGAIGRTDLEGGDYDALIVSIMEKLMPLDSGVAVYPGHGAPSSIGTERVTNPFLEPFNEREEIPELNEAYDKD